MRRFAELTFRSLGDRDVLNSIDWLDLWRSVDECGPDPLEPFQQALITQQQQNRDRSSVEIWATTVKSSNSFQKRSALYQLFREWEDENFPGWNTTIARFATKMAKLCLQADFPFDRTRTREGWSFKTR